MTLLRNHLCKEDCLKRVAAETFERTTLSFYRYVKVEHPKAFRDDLFREWSELGVLGRIYVAREGINAQISVPSPRLEEFRAALDSHPELKDMHLNIAIEQQESFWKLSIKVKHQIVADGLAEDSYDLSQVGNHLNPEEFHAALEDPEAIAVDFRNFYESRIGRFEGAICPDSDTFKEELPMVADLLASKKDKKLLLYCTGGIRCEKASAYLKNQGFTNVNQLRGGIITYVQTLKSKGIEPKFLGQNYVFDERISERVTQDVLTECDQCLSSWDLYTNCSNAACNLLFIQCPACAEKMEGACTPECLAIVHLPEEERKAHFKQQVSSDLRAYKSRLRPRTKIKVAH